MAIRFLCLPTIGDENLFMCFPEGLLAFILNFELQINHSQTFIISLQSIKSIYQYSIKFQILSYYSLHTLTTVHALSKYTTGESFNN